VATNLVNIELDFVDDINGSMKIASENRNTIGKLEIGEIEKLSSSDYAIVFMTKHGEDGRYPLKTADQTKLSCVYLKENAAKLPKSFLKIASSRLKEACDKHGIKTPPFISENANGNADNHLVSPYVEESEKFACQNKYPINSKNEVKTAIEYFEKNAKLFTPDEALEYCGNVIKEAEEHNIRIPHSSKINDYDERNFSNILKLAIDKRIELLNGIYEYGDKDGDAIKLSYTRLYNKKNDVTPREFSTKLAHLDKVAGIDTHWDKGSICNPYVSTFKRMNGRMIKVGEQVVTRGQLMKLAEKDNFNAAFDKNFVDSFKENPEVIFDSLPRPDKKLIISMMED